MTDTAPIEVARVVATSSAPADAFFARWIDLPSHTEWASSMEWFQIDGPVVVGARGTSKSVGNPPAPFRVTVVDSPTTYADTTELDGAELTVHHHAEPSVSGGCEITILAWLEGPAAADMAPGMREGIQPAIEADVAALVGLVERAQQP